MSPYEYCERVRQALEACDPGEEELGRYYCDRGKALRATCLALEGYEVHATDLAEDVADRWNLVV